MRVDDVARLQRALLPVQEAATSLSWNAERPWTVETHVGLDAGVPTVDLHDLGRKTAVQAVELSCELAPDLQIGALFFVVGRGRRSIGGPVLPRVVGERLREICAEQGWRLREPRAGRYAVIIDPARAPASATGALGWGFWLWVLFVASAAVLALARSCLG